MRNMTTSNNDNRTEMCNFMTKWIAQNDPTYKVPKVVTTDNNQLNIIQIFCYQKIIFLPI